MTLLWLAASAAADTCPAYGLPDVIEVGGVPETSGIAVSRTREKVVFVHQDKGSEPVVHAVDIDGDIVGEHLLTNADNEDWEDIAAAPCPDEGDCLYIGDIGDNDASRANITVYVVREPERGDDKIKAIERWVAVYPDGPVDAEALMVMPCSGRVHVVTKSTDGLSVIYRFPAEIDGTVTLEEVGRIEVEGAVAEAREVTGGDWDLDGDRVALRTSSQILEWVTDPERPNAHWTSAPQVIPGANERQGEAVAYGLQGELWTATEGGLQLGLFACDGLEPADHDCVFPQTGRTCGCASSPAPTAGWLFAGVLVFWRRYKRTVTVSSGAISVSNSIRTGTAYSG